jgi:hypothetical protein
LNGKVAAPVWKTEINGLRDPLRLPRDTLYPQKLVLTSPTCGGRSVGIVRLRTKGHGVSFLVDRLCSPTVTLVIICERKVKSIDIYKIHIIYKLLKEKMYQDLKLYSQSCFLVLVFYINITTFGKWVQSPSSDIRFVLNSCGKNKHWKFAMKTI